MNISEEQQRGYHQDQWLLTDQAGQLITAATFLDDIVQKLRNDCILVTLRYWKLVKCTRYRI